MPAGVSYTTRTDRYISSEVRPTSPRPRSPSNYTSSYSTKTDKFSSLPRGRSPPPTVTTHTPRYSSLPRAASPPPVATSYTTRTERYTSSERRGPSPPPGGTPSKPERLHSAGPRHHSPYISRLDHEPTRPSSPPAVRTLTTRTEHYSSTRSVSPRPDVPSYTTVRDRYLSPARRSPSPPPAAATYTRHVERHERHVQHRSDSPESGESPRHRPVSPPLYSNTVQYRPERHELAQTMLSTRHVSSTERRSVSPMPPRGRDEPDSHRTLPGRPRVTRRLVEETEIDYIVPRRSSPSTDSSPDRRVTPGRHSTRPYRQPEDRETPERYSTTKTHRTPGRESPEPRHTPDQYNTTKTYRTRGRESPEPRNTPDTYTTTKTYRTRQRESPDDRSPPDRHTTVRTYRPQERDGRERTPPDYYTTSSVTKEYHSEDRHTSTLDRRTYPESFPPPRAHRPDERSTPERRPDVLEKYTSPRQRRPDDRDTVDRRSTPETYTTSMTRTSRRTTEERTGTDRLEVPGKVSHRRSPSPRSEPMRRRSPSPRSEPLRRDPADPEPPIKKISKVVRNGIARPADDPNALLDDRIQNVTERYFAPGESLPRSDQLLRRSSPPPSAPDASQALDIRRPSPAGGNYDDLRLLFERCPSAVRRESSEPEPGLRVVRETKRLEDGREVTREVEEYTDERRHSHSRVERYKISEPGYEATSFHSLKRTIVKGTSEAVMARWSLHGF